MQTVSILLVRSPRSAIRNRLSGDRLGLQLLGLVVRDEGVDDLVERALHDEVELVDGEADAVVGDAVLFEVVGANLFVAAAAADNRAALACQRLVLLLLFEFL